MSKKCLYCVSTDLVYSGVDAFLLGVDTETVCYTCANNSIKSGVKVGA